MKKVCAAKTVAFCAIFLCLAAVFIAAVVMNSAKEYNAVRYVEFTTVPLCFAASLLRLKKTKTDGALVACALLFTACADFLMIILQSYYSLSILFFAAAQLVYCARIHLLRRDKNYSAITLCLRAAICAAAAVAAAAATRSATLALAAFYFTNLLMNAAEVSSLFNKGKHIILFFAGLVLFICCDICVGLNAAADFVQGVNIGGKGLFAINILIWIFYIPSQVLLALSGKKENIYDERKEG